MLVKGSMGMQNFQSKRIGQFCFDYVIDKKNSIKDRHANVDFRFELAVPSRCLVSGW